MTEIKYKELGYALNGIFFKVQNNLGAGHREKFYCQAIIQCLKDAKMPFVYQHKVNLEIEDKIFGRRFFDFLIDDKIVVEIKVGNKIPPANFAQIKEYLRISGYQLGLLVVFRSEDVKIYRVLNIDQ